MGIEVELKPHALTGTIGKRTTCVLRHQCDAISDLDL